MVYDGSIPSSYSNDLPSSATRREPSVPGLGYLNSMREAYAALTNCCEIIFSDYLPSRLLGLESRVGAISRRSSWPSCELIWKPRRICGRANCPDWKRLTIDPLSLVPSSSVCGYSLLLATLILCWLLVPDWSTSYFRTWYPVPSTQYLVRKGKGVAKRVA